MWKTIAFASRFLNIAKMKFGDYDLELLGLVGSLDQFENYQKISKNKISTDQKALLGTLRDIRYAKTTQ